MSLQLHYPLKSSKDSFTIFKLPLCLIQFLGYEYDMISHWSWKWLSRMWSNFLWKQWSSESFTSLTKVCLSEWVTIRPPRQSKGCLEEAELFCIVLIFGHLFQWSTYLRAVMCFSLAKMISIKCYEKIQTFLALQAVAVRTEPWISWICGHVHYLFFW